MSTKAALEDDTHAQIAMLRDACDEVVVIAEAKVVRPDAAERVAEALHLH